MTKENDSLAQEISHKPASHQPRWMTRIGCAVSIKRLNPAMRVAGLDKVEVIKITDAW